MTPSVAATPTPAQSSPFKPQAPSSKAELQIAPVQTALSLRPSLSPTPASAASASASAAASPHAHITSPPHPAGSTLNLIIWIQPNHHHSHPKGPLLARQRSTFKCNCNCNCPAVRCPAGFLALTSSSRAPGRGAPEALRPGARDSQGRRAVGRLPPGKVANDVRGVSNGYVLRPGKVRCGRRASGLRLPTLRH